MLVTWASLGFSHIIMQVMCLANHIRDQVFFLYIFNDYYYFNEGKWLQNDLVVTKDKDPYFSHIDVLWN